jgi:hypothetical protein
MSGLIAVGVSKQLTIAKETTFATAALSTSGQLMRRTTSNVDLAKKTYKSTEIRPDYQFSDFRHGTRSVTGTISDELSVGTWAQFMSSVVRQAWQKAGSTVATAIDAQPTAPQFTRTGGSFITDGYCLGDVVQFEGFTTGLANNANNFFITGITALTLSGIFLNGSAVVTDAASAAVSVSVMGSKTWMPLTGQTRDSYTIEHFFSDIGQSELFTGCRVSQMAVKLPSTGLATIDFPILGINAVEAPAQYFTNPTAPSNGQILAAVNGAMFLGGQQIAVITSLDFTVNGNMTSGDVVGSNVAPDIFPGSMDVTGNMSAYFEDETFQSAFFNETEVSVVIALTTDSTPNAAFQVFSFPRCKLNGATKNDGQVGIVQTVPFVALLNNLSPLPGTLVTTMSIQDSTIATGGSPVALG